MASPATCRREPGAATSLINSLASHTFRPYRTWRSRNVGEPFIAGMPVCSFHPTAVERRNGPSAPHWVENKFNKINGIRQIEGEPPHRARRIELLCDRDERYTLRVKEFDEPGKIGERPRQPVDLVDNDDIDPAGPDIGEQVLQRRSLQIAVPEKPPSS